MAKVTKLAYQKRNKDRVNVYLDDAFAFGLAVNAAITLRVGQELDDADIAELQAADTFERAYAKALRFLGYRARSEKEIRDKLKRKTRTYTDPPPDDVIDAVLEKLRGKGYVNDSVFANDWVENRQQFRPRSRRMLAMELRNKGMARDDIDAALADVDDYAAAVQAAQPQLEKLAKYHDDYQTFRKKLGGFLGRRGFTYDVVNTVVREYWDELRDDSPPDPDESEIG